MSQRPCCVPYCNNKTSRRYAIPKSEVVRNIWINRIGNNKLNGIDDHRILKNYTVCMEHFHPMCINPNGSLMNFALPSMNFPGFAGGAEDCFYHPEAAVTFKTPEKVREALKGSASANVELKVEIEISPVARTYHTGFRKRKLFEEDIVLEDVQMESTDNTKTQIMLETIEMLDDDGAECDSSENIIEESISIQETEVQRGEKGVKREHKEDDDVEILDLKTDIVNSDVEVGLPLKDCCAHHQDRIKELEHQLKICHEVINTFIMKTEVELEIKKINRPEDQFSQKRWKHEIDLLKMQNNQLICEVKFMKIKEEKFQSRLNHLLYLLNTERDNQNQLKATRSREQSRWNTLRNRLEKTIEEKENECTTIKERETKLNVSLKKKEMRCVKLLKEIKSLNEKLQKEEPEPCRYCGL